MQVSANLVQMRVDLVQRSNKPNSDQSIIKETHRIANQMRALNVATKFENLRAEQWPAI